MFGRFGILAKGEGYMLRIVPSVFFARCSCDLN